MVGLLPAGSCSVTSMLPPKVRPSTWYDSAPVSTAAPDGRLLPATSSFFTPENDVPAGAVTTTGPTTDPADVNDATLTNWSVMSVGSVSMTVEVWYA